MSPIVYSLYGRSWWSLLLKGLVASIIGIIAISRPAGFLEVIFVLLGVLILIAGIAGTIGAIVFWKSAGRPTLVLLPSLLGIVVGLLTILSPQITARLLIYLIAIWAIVYGIGEISKAMKLRREIEGEWIQLLLGIIAVVFGIVLILKPITAGALAVALAGFFLLALGIFWIVMAIRTKRWQQWQD